MESRMLRISTHLFVCVGGVAVFAGLASWVFGLFGAGAAATGFVALGSGFAGATGFVLVFSGFTAAFAAGFEAVVAGLAAGFAALFAAIGVFAVLDVFVAIANSLGGRSRNVSLIKAAISSKSNCNCQG
jgi:hypothetical protein